MSINKFGNHLFNRNQQQQQPPACICDLSSLYSKCVLTIRGTVTKAFVGYTLENRSDTYVFPISGRIESIEIIPKDVSVMLNNEKVEFPQTLIGRDIKKEDKIIFSKDKNTSTLYAQIILRCPLTKNG